MVFLGFISLLQIILLPGLIITKFIYSGKTLSKLILSFSISLIFNYQLVLLLTIFNLYNRISVYIIFAVELVLLLSIYLKGISPQKYSNVHARIEPHSENKFLTLSASQISILKYVFVGTGLFVCLGYIFKIMGENPGIFDSWDDVVSWNSWASEWYSGHFPLRSYHYPQLLPANWSLTYKFIGTDEVQFFAKSIMGLFGLGILLIFWDLYAKSKSIFFLVALTFSGYLVLKTIGQYLGKGYTDIPVAFYSICIFYVFYLGINGYMSCIQTMVISAIVLSGATLTKQAGFFTILLYITMAVCLFKTNRYLLKKSLQIFCLSAGICMLLTGPWYIFKQFQINKGIDHSEISWVTHDIYAGKSKSQRFTEATAIFLNKMTDFDSLKSIPNQYKNVLSGAVILFFLLFIVLSTVSFYGRIILATVIIPYYIAWACFFSYDLRNIALLLPFLGLSAAIGATIFYKYFSALYTLLLGNRFFSQYGIILILVLTIAVISFKYDKKYLLQKEQAKATSLLGDSTLNFKLYELYDSGKLRANILTGDPLLRYLPIIKQFCIAFDYSKQNLDTLKILYLKNLKDHKIMYFIFQESVPPEIRDFFSQKETEGELKFIFRSNAAWRIEELVVEDGKNK
jgi:hypothetical protein